jgi:hypothetical protein
MKRSDKQQDTVLASGEDIFADVVSLSKKRITDMLLRMIDSAADYHGWSLSDQDGARVVKLIKRKQSILCSSFSFQLRKHFLEFEEGNKSRTHELGARDWLTFGIDGTNGAVEINELQNITDRYEKVFKEFDHTILKRLQTCIKRSRASIYESPLQVKRLCESFRYAIDSLNLEISYKVALYHLFSDRFIESLGPLYRNIDQLLLDQGMLPELSPARIQLRSIEGLSQSKSPDSINPNQNICLLMILQRLKEKSKRATSHYKNLFPDLKQQLTHYEIEGYEEQIDQLSMIFKLIFEDEELPVPVKQQLGRVQIYVFITATQEDDFLRRSSNPARRLLDAVVKNEVEISRQGDSDFSGIRFIREHIDALTDREFITLDSYVKMLGEYQAFLHQNEIDVRKTRKREATRKYMPLVKSRLDELTQPLKIQGTSLILFEKVWLPLMVQMALQQGMDSDIWHKAIAMVRKQVWSLIPKSSPEEQEELLKTLPMVSHSLHRAMRSLKLAESLQQSLRDYLKLEQQEVLDQTARNLEEKQRRTRSLGAQSFDSMKDNNDEFDAMMQTGMFQVSPDMLESLNAAKPPTPNKINQVDALSKGEWVNIKVGHDSQLAKLAWKSEDASLFIFVDRDGKKVSEVDSVKLAAQFESGEVSLTDSDTVSSEKSRFSIMKSL